MLATLGCAPLFAALALKPSATQSGADDRAPYDGKSMAERFPNLVVPKSTPLGYVPGSDPREKTTGTADNPTHVIVQNGRDLSRSSLDYFTRLLTQPGGTTGFDLRSTPLNGPGALPSAP
jgi:hypothetical protein